MDRPRLVSLFALGTLVLALSHPLSAAGQSKVVLYGIHMDPSSQDAKDFSSASFGGGLKVVATIPGMGSLLAGSAGVDDVNFLSETHAYVDPVTGLRVEQQTDQYFYRLFAGPEFGPHGDGFLRPHVGVHLALVDYRIATDVVVPDDYNRENEIRQNLRSENRLAFGYDIHAGTDLNFGRFLVEGGGRLVKSFNVPQQLGDGAVTIHPAYLQIYLGVGLNGLR